MISALHALEFDGQRAVLGCAPAAAPAIHSQRDVLADLLQAVLGRPVQVTITESDHAPAPVAPPSPAAQPPAPAAAEPPARAAVRTPSEIPPEVRDHPLVKKVESTLGARLVDFVPATGE